MSLLEDLFEPVAPYLSYLEPLFNRVEFEWLIYFLVLVGAWLILRLLFISRETKKLMQITDDEALANEIVNRKRRSFSYFARLKGVLYLFFKFKEKKHLADVIYFSILLLEAGLFLAFIYFGIPLLAIAFPLVLHWLIIKIFEVSTVTIHDHIKKELPNTIKHMTKVLTRTSDLKTVMYETSLDMNEPLRSMFFDVSRRMITENYEKVLLDFASEVDDTWLYAFSFLLISYKDDSKKSDIIKNLNVLSNMIEKENEVREKAITDKKFLVIMNYLILILAVFLSVFSFILNPVAIDFFFGSIIGMACFLLGVSALLGTVVVNFMMMNPRE